MMSSLRAAALGLAAATVAACVGGVEPLAPGSDPIDAGRSDDATPRADARIGLADAMLPDCVDATTPPTPHHNAGQSCITAACHDGGGLGGAPRWTIAGTLYTTNDGLLPVTGATVVVTDSAGVKTSVVTATDGSFWTAQGLTFPISLKATRCPDTRQMAALVPDGSGSCNAAGCHDGAMRIHLP
jgi:hypothetical protein